MTNGEREISGKGGPEQATEWLSTKRRKFGGQRNENPGEGLECTQNKKKERTEKLGSTCCKKN